MLACPVITVSESDEELSSSVSKLDSLLEVLDSCCEEPTFPGKVLNSALTLSRDFIAIAIAIDLDEELDSLVEKLDSLYEEPNSPGEVLILQPGACLGASQPPQTCTMSLAKLVEELNWLRGEPTSP